MSFQNIDHVELIAASNASWGSNEEEEEGSTFGNFVVDIVNAKVVYDINESSNNIKRRNCCILFYFNKFELYKRSVNDRQNRSC